MFFYLKALWVEVFLIKVVAAIEVVYIVVGEVIAKAELIRTTQILVHVLNLLGSCSR